MDIMSDESRLREMFDDMTADQPDQPLARYHRVRARARRHRSAQAASILAVAAVVTGSIAIGLSARAGRSVAASRPVPAWALPWPDHRNGSVPQKVLDGAVTAWRHDAVGSEAVSLASTARAKVLWYVGRTAVHGQVVLVVFETDSPAGRRLVAGWATASEVMHGQSAWRHGVSPWVLYDVRAPRPAAGLAIGLNVHGTSADIARNPDNWIAVLAAPDVQSITFSAPGQTTGSSSTAKFGVGSTSRGLLIADMGQISGPVKLTALYVGHHNTLRAPAIVGVPGSKDSQEAQLAIAAPLVLPRGFRQNSEFTGQGDESDGLSVSRGRLTIVARCYGPSPLRLALDAGPQTSLGTLPCDNAVHELITHVRLRPQGSATSVGIYTSGFTSYRVAIGSVR